MTPVTPEAEPLREALQDLQEALDNDEMFRRLRKYDRHSWANEVANLVDPAFRVLEARAASPDRPEPPGANLYITNCVHGVDLRFVPRCYLCNPVTPDRLAGGLDVERLARALFTTRPLLYPASWPNDDPYAIGPSPEEDARRIIAEYDRLSGLTEDPDAGPWKCSVCGGLGAHTVMGVEDIPDHTFRPPEPKP